MIWPTVQRSPLPYRSQSSQARSEILNPSTTPSTWTALVYLTLHSLCPWGCQYWTNVQRQAGMLQRQQTQWPQQ